MLVGRFKFFWEVVFISRGLLGFFGNVVFWCSDGDRFDMLSFELFEDCI